jgi:cytoskeletal protein RodZ
MITVGEVLQKQREKLDKSLEQVALDTKIQPRFIKYIEDDDFKKFDSSVYAQGFIKIYAKYLDLDEERILAIYRRSVPEKYSKDYTLRETESKTVRRINITPQTLAIVLSVLFLTAILSYIGYQVYQFQSPPEITILSPEDQTSVDVNEVEVKGVIDTNSSLFINENPIDIDQEGNFLYTLDLNPGVNLITIQAKKNNSTQESVETLNITYEAPENEQTEKTEENIEPEINMVRLEIVNSSVWVQLNVDKENKLSQIVQAGDTYDYEVTEEFSLTTGIIASTKLFFNDQSVPINQNASSVGSVTCEINQGNQIECE